jgi:hypothetical protein
MNMRDIRSKCKIAGIVAGYFFVVPLTGNLTRSASEGAHPLDSPRNHGGTFPPCPLVRSRIVSKCKKAGNYADLFTWCR